MTSVFRAKTRRIAMLLLFVFFIGLICSGCNVDYFAGKRPSDYGGADWVCEDPNIILHINPNSAIGLELPDLEEGDSLRAVFSYGADFLILKDTETEGTVIAFKGSCRFGSEKMKVHVTQDDLFGGAYWDKTVVFVREKVK